MSGRTGLNIYFNTLALLVNNKPLFPYQNTWALQSMYTARKSSYREPWITKWLRSLTWLGGRLLSNWTPGTTGMPSTIIRKLPRTQTSLFWWKCARKGRREGEGFACRLYPSHGSLRFITSHSFRARLCHAKNEAPEEEADSNACFIRIGLSVPVFSPPHPLLGSSRNTPPEGVCHEKCSSSWIMCIKSLVYRL